MDRVRLWQPGSPRRCRPTRVLSLKGEHLPGVQQQQAAGPEAQVDPLLGPGHRAAPEEVHRQEAQPVVLQRGNGPRPRLVCDSGPSVFFGLVILNFGGFKSEKLPVWFG